VPTAVARVATSATRANARRKSPIATRERNRGVGRSARATLWTIGVDKNHNDLMRMVKSIKHCSQMKIRRSRLR